MPSSLQCSIQLRPQSIHQDYFDQANWGFRLMQWLQDTLELSQEQQAAMLMARKSLLKTLTGVQGRRERIILELGVALLQKKPVGIVFVIIPKRIAITNIRHASNK